MPAQLQAVIYQGGATLTAFLYEIALVAGARVPVGESLGYAQSRVGNFYYGVVDVVGDKRIVYKDAGGVERAEGFVRLVDGEICEPVGSQADLELATAADVAAGLTVVPLTGVVQARTEGTTISVFVAETVTVSVAVIDATGASVDVSAMTLTLIIERMNGTDVSVIANADITKVSSTLSFAVPSAVSANEGLYRWTLRQATGNAVVMGGVLSVEYAPKVDAA